jgi:hypothetical protein
MKFWYAACTLLLMFIKPVAAQAPASGSGDRIASAHQFLREFFPQLAGRTAEIEYTARQPLQQKIGYLSLGFRVIDLCLPAAGQNVAPVGNLQRPCSEYDKRYQSPLAGEFTFQNVHGRLVMVQGVFKGTTINSHEPGAHWQTCSMGEVHSEDDIIQKLRLKLLAPFLGGVLRVESVEKETGPAWTVHLAVGGKVPSRYFFMLDECGSIFDFGKI